MGRGEVGREWGDAEWRKLLAATTPRPFKASEVVIQRGVDDRARRAPERAADRLRRPCQKVVVVVQVRIISHSVSLSSNECDVLRGAAHVSRGPRKRSSQYRVKVDPLVYVPPADPR